MADVPHAGEGEAGEAGDRVVLQGDLGHVPETLMLFVMIRVYWHRIVRSMKNNYFNEK